jgi:hypothetical protein
LTPEDRVAAKRLDGLLDYVEALVKLDERPATRLAEHKLVEGSQFILHQHEISGLPGRSADFSDADGPIWLRVVRLQRTQPPVVPEDCPPWIEVSNDPTKPPIIQEVLRVPEEDMTKMIATGEARAEDCAPSINACSRSLNGSCSPVGTSPLS